MYAQDLQGGEGYCTIKNKYLKFTFSHPQHMNLTQVKNLVIILKFMLTEPNSFPSYVGEKKV